MSAHSWFKSAAMPKPNTSRTVYMQTYTTHASIPVSESSATQDATAWLIQTTDYHAAGEPFRIVSELPFDIPGDTVLERRDNASTGPADVLRRLLVNEPRGHADMYGGFIVPPDDHGADFGVLFWHKDGFSTACGHGSMALGAWAVRSGLVSAPDDGDTDVIIDVPSGRVHAIVHMVSGIVDSVTFRNVPSHVVATKIPLTVKGMGEVEVDVIWGGALYASLPAERLELQVGPDYLTGLIAAGRAVKAALAAHPTARHPSDPRLDGIYGAVLFEDVPVSAEVRGAVMAQRNITVFADGQVDRSPCGSATAARVAALHGSGRLGLGEVLEHRSIINTVFAASVVEDSPAGIIVEVVGNAFEVARSSFSLDPADPLGCGFVLR